MASCGKGVDEEAGSGLLDIPAESSQKGLTAIFLPLASHYDAHLGPNFDLGGEGGHFWRKLLICFCLSMK